MAKLQKQWVEANAIGGAALRLENATALRARNFADSADIDVLLVDASDKLVFQTQPEYAVAPTAADHLVNKTYADLMIPLSQKAVANGVASLDGSGLVPAAQLPSYVDDVEEYANLAAFPATGETGKIYVALDTNLTYRWSGSAYVEISAGPATTDDLAEGSTNLYGTVARSRAAAILNSSAGSETDQGMSVAAAKTYSNTVADAKISDVAFGVGWDGDLTIGASKNAIYDAITAVSSGAAASGIVNQVQLSDGAGGFNDDALSMATTTQRLTVGDGTLTSPMFIVDSTALGTSYVQFKHGGVTKADIFSNTSAGLSFRSSGGNGWKFINDAATDVVLINNAGEVTIDDLSGTGVRSVTVDATGKLIPAALDASADGVVGSVQLSNGSGGHSSDVGIVYDGATGELQLSDAAGAAGLSVDAFTGNAATISLKSNGVESLGISNSGGTTVVSQVASDFIINAGANANALRVKASGFVGMNEGSPDSQLHVTASATQVLTLENTASTNTAMAFQDAAVNSAYILKTGVDGNLQFRIGTSNIGANTKLSISGADGAVTIDELSGTGTRNIAVDSTGKLVPQAVASVETATRETFTLSGADITNQYVDLLQEMVDFKERFIFKGAPMQLRDDDYTVSLTGGAGSKTRFSFAGDVAANAVAGDKIQIFYSFI